MGDGRVVLEEFTTPARHGRGCIVKKGQILRITEAEGKQVADVSFLNADNHREGFHAGQTLALNMLEGIGDLRRVTKLYSRPPYENVMLTVVDDPVGVHFAWMGGRCTPRIYEVRNRMGIGRRVDASAHRTCQQNLEEAVAPFGVDADMVPDVFNMFMNARIDERGLIYIGPPTARKGDYMDLRAEMEE